MFMNEVNLSLYQVNRTINEWTQRLRNLT